LFFIGTIVLPTLVWLDQPIKLITLVGIFNIVEHVIELVKPMFKSLVLSYIPTKSIHVQFVKIVIPPNTFQQHLSETFFHPKVKKWRLTKRLFESEFKTFAL
jgi:hypothetical protein